MCIHTHIQIHVIQESYILGSQGATWGVNSPVMLPGDQGSWFNCPGLLKINTALALLIRGFDYFTEQGEQELLRNWK